MKNCTVLIVDDEENMRTLMEMYLLNSGYHCLQAPDGKQAISLLEKHEVDLILLDIMMPGDNGFTVCEKIHQKWDLPVIFVSAKGAEWDKVKGLKLGADDFVVKPFHPGELVARVEAVLRRSGKKQQRENETLSLGKIKMNLRSRTASIGGNAVNLTLKEYELLIYLITNKKQALSREQLLAHVWGVSYEGSLRTVDTHIKTLRMKLKSADYIQTVWGIGYKIEEEYEA